MRPIDADALIERIKDRYCTECDNYNGVRCRACSADDAISMVDESQTAEAIPLEWLTKRMGEELDNAVLYGGDHMNIARSCWNVLEVWKREAKA